MSQTNEHLPDHYVAEFLDLATSAHVYFELINDRLTMRAVNPQWEMWRPFRHLLDEIGARRIEQYLRDNRGHTTH
jgi:hypothetical protein